MKNLVQAPIFFERNRVWRVYTGGELFHELMGDAPEDSHYPEEWVASTVRAANERQTVVNEGLSVISGTDITLEKLINEYPKETVGKSKGRLEILVKYLDSAIRLPMQVHPDREYSEAYFNSPYGKTEMWLILATRKDASICFGFKEKISKEEFAILVERGKDDPKVMDGYLNRFPVKPGEVYLIPGKAVHAIGAGCLILEVQEPTDFTIQPEYWCGNHCLSEQEMYMGLAKDIALECFDYSLYGKECIKKSRKYPRIVEETPDYYKEALITREDTPCFAVDRYFVNKKMVLSSSPSIYVVTQGCGIICGEHYMHNIKRGDYFFLPVAAQNNFIVQKMGLDTLELVSCMPPA